MYGLVSLGEGKDWLFRPLVHGLCKYESYKDGTLDLGDIAIMNNILNVKFENERIISEKAKNG